MKFVRWLMPFFAANVDLHIVCRKPRSAKFIAVCYNSALFHKAMSREGL